jgi:hypothetical protein
MTEHVKRVTTPRQLHILPPVIDPHSPPPPLSHSHSQLDLLLTLPVLLPSCAVAMVDQRIRWRAWVTVTRVVFRQNRHPLLLGGTFCHFLHPGSLRGDSS